MLEIKKKKKKKKNTLKYIKFGRRIKNKFSGKVRETSELFKKFFPILELTICVC